MYRVWLSFYSIAIGDPHRGGRIWELCSFVPKQNNNTGPERWKRESKT